MKRLAILVLGAALLFGSLVGLAVLLIESGEVVVLHTTDGQGSTFQTRLWIVDHQDRPWVGTTDPSHTTWVARLRTHPRVELERGRVRECRVAVFVTDAALRARVNSLYDEKYRIPLYGSRFLKIIGGIRRDVEEQVLIVLDPCPAKG